MTCKDCIHKTACITANPDMVKKTYHCEHYLPTADVVELSKVKEIIMQYIAEQTVSKYPSSELCRCARMSAEGVIYALEYAFEGGEGK